MEGIPIIKVVSSTETQAPILPRQEKALPVGMLELTQSSITTYYASMGVKELIK